MSLTDPRAVAITGPCICHEGFTCRKKIDPQCAYHGYAHEIAHALADAERRGMERAYHAAACKYAEWINGHEFLEIPRFEDWLEARAWARADKEAPHGTDAE